MAGANALKRPGGFLGGGVAKFPKAPGQPGFGAAPLSDDALAAAYAAGVAAGQQQTAEEKAYQAGLAAARAEMAGKGGVGKGGAGPSFGMGKGKSNGKGMASPVQAASWEQSWGDDAAWQGDAWGGDATWQQAEVPQQPTGYQLGGRFFQGKGKGKAGKGK